MKKYLFAFTILIFLLQGCEKPQVTPVVPTEYDELDFLVQNSDLIAIVFLTGGISDDRKPSIKRYKVSANVLKEIKNHIETDTILIENSAFFKDDSVLIDFMILNNGNYLAFLKKNGEYYNPVSGSAMLEIHNNQVDPLWKQSANFTGEPSGRIDIIIEEIKETASNQSLNSDG